MAVTLANSGTQAATISTEHSLDIQSAVAGVFQAMVDISAMVAGDVTEIRIYEKPTGAGDTKRCTQLYRMRGPVGGQDGLRTIPVMQTIYHEVTLKQTAGTGRSYKWGVNKA